MRETIYISDSISLKGWIPGNIEALESYYGTPSIARNY